jgi:PAS domain S-box-containing protein
MVTGELENGRLLDKVLEQLPAAVVIAEAPSGRVLLANRQVSEILGFPWTPASEIGAYNDEVIGWHTDGRRVEPEEWPLARSLTAGEVVHNEEIQVRRGDGTRAWISLNSAPVRDDEGNIVAAVVTFLDITARKAAERRAIEENRRTALTLESIAEGFFLLDENWRIQYVNREAERLLERKRDDLLESEIWNEYPELVATKFLSEFNRARDEQVVAVFDAVWPATKRRLAVRAWPSVDGLGLAVYFQEAAA